MTEIEKKVAPKKLSLAALEAKIESLKKSPKTKTKAVAAEIKELQTTLNKLYVENKRKVMNFERENHSYIAFLRSTHGFYKVLENSLYYYAFDVAPKLKIETRIYSDGDYEAKSESGVVSVKDLAEVEEKLAKLEIKRAKISSKTDDIVIFKLPWTYSEETLQKFADQNTYLLHKYNHVIMAENTIPVLYMDLNELLKACYENVRRLEPTAREALGNMIVELVAEMLRLYIELTNGRVSEAKAFLGLRSRLNKVKSQVKILADLKLWNARTYARVGRLLIKVQDVIDVQERQGN